MYIDRNFFQLNGQFCAGGNSDLLILSSELKTLLFLRKMVVVENGYPDSKCGRAETALIPKNMFERIRENHETANGRL